MKETSSAHSETMHAAEHCSHVPAKAGEQNILRLIQCKLTVGAINDPLETEADTMADQVMRMPAQSFIQRKCKHCEEEEKAQLKPISSAIQKKDASGNNQTAISDVTSSTINSTRGGGNALDASTKDFMESRFGADFSSVRIHTGEYASKLSNDLQTQAFTIGSDIYFNSEKYIPDSASGKHLLAHELTHVIQQSENIPQQIRRQPKDDKGPKSEIGKELNKNELFQKLPKFARDKILDEVDKAPETITKAVLDKIIDLAPIDNQYKEGLKKVGEGIINAITNRKSPSTSTCDAAAGYYEGKTRDFKGMCCHGTFESAQTCCPKDKLAIADPRNCCSNDEYVNAENKCEKFKTIDPTEICTTPGKKDSLGKCCMPPFDVVDGMCVAPQKPEPKPQPFSLSFKLGVIDDYNINESVLNSRQKPRFETIKKQIHDFMEVCPASMVMITGFADKPGTEEHNMDLGQRRADHIKFHLQLALMKLRIGGLPSLIFTRSEGETNPVHTDAGEKFSAANRRVEIEFNSMCPPLGSRKPFEDTPLRPQRPWTFSR